jgi:tetratricopeptide (TPR) repeat protein
VGSDALIAAKPTNWGNTREDFAFWQHVIALHLAGWLLFAQSGDTLLGTRNIRVFEEASRLSLSGHHAEALRFASSWERRASQEGQLLCAGVDLAAFSDLHDPARLESARASLDKLSKLARGHDPHSRLILALARSQQSYLASLEGRNISSALWGRSAASVAQELLDRGVESPELKGVLGGYLFWKSQSLGSLGRALGGDERTRGLAWTIQSAASESPFRDAFRTSLLWIRFERGEYPEALRVARCARAEWPKNRLYRQAEGDVLFRMGRFQEALEVYRESFREYAGLETVPVNRLAAAGNLARIHAALGRTDSACAWLDTLDSPRYRFARRWLVPSLLDELGPVRRKLSCR